MTRILIALCLAIFLFIASVPAKAEAPSASDLVGMAYDAGIMVGCYRAISILHKHYGYSFHEGDILICKFILDKYGSEMGK